MAPLNATPRKGASSIACAATLALLVVSSVSPVAAQKLNEIIALGSHDSFHRLQNDRPIADAWKYDHPPLAEQASTYNIRHFEFDVRDLDGANFPVSHVPGFDFNSSCATLTDCVQQLRDWSLDNRGHIPIFVLLEFIGSHNTTEGWNQLDRVLADIWGEDLLTPAKLQGDFNSLREAIVENQAWPNVEDSRGMAIFMVQRESDDGEREQEYLRASTTPSAFQLFPFPNNANDDIDEKAVFLLADDVAGDDEVVIRAREGYMIRARADNSDEFVYPVRPLTEEANLELLEQFFNVVDVDQSGVANLTEVNVYINAILGEPLEGVFLSVFNSVLDSCLDDPAGFVLADLVCVQEQVANLGFALPPGPSDYVTVEDVTARRDGTLPSGAHLIATDHFIEADAADAGGYFFDLADGCEFYLNPASDACRSPPASIPEECRPLECIPLPRVSAATRADAAATMAGALVLSYLAMA